MSVDPKEIRISNDSMDLIWKYFNAIPTIQMCRNVIRQQLFSNGIDFNKKKRSRDTTMQQIMDDYWLPFCEDALDAALCYGFVPWRTVKIEGNFKVPIICLKDTYNIGLKEVNGVIEYKIYDVGDNSNNELEGANIYDEFGYRPRVNGELMSVIYTLIPDIQYYYTMANTQITLEKQKTAPPIITEIQERNKGGVGGDNEGIDYDFFADADLAKAEEDSKFRRNKSAVNDLAKQKKLYDEFFNPTQEVQVSTGDIFDRVVAIPAGQRVSNYRVEQSRGDVGNILKQLQDTICGIFGVPKSMIMSDTPHKSDAAGTHKVFQQTIMWWKRQMSEMMQHIYNVINTDDISKRIIESQ